jgi:hypothetical protein
MKRFNWNPHTKKFEMTWAQLLATLIPTFIAGIVIGLAISQLI